MIYIPKIVANSIVITTGPEPGPTAPDGKVLYKTTAGGEWLQDDANISNGEFTGFANKANAVEVIIPSKDSSGNTVTSIGSDAFGYCSRLTSVTIPDSVTSIGEGAFFHCIGLTRVAIGNSVTKIDADAFFECTSVDDVYCYPNPANLTWNEADKDDFKSDGLTVCHVKAEYLSAYQTKFGSTVNVTFVGDLA